MHPKPKHYIIVSISGGDNTFYVFCVPEKEVNAYVEKNQSYVPKNDENQHKIVAILNTKMFSGDLGLKLRMFVLQPPWGSE